MTPIQNETERIKELYENIKSIPSYSAKLSEFLRLNDVHSKHRRIVRKTFPRRKIISRFPFEIWQADLIEYTQKQYKFKNRRYVYILVVIDLFTKRIWAVPMKHKNGPTTAAAFESIFDSVNEFPTHLITDKGTEFTNWQVQKIFQNYDINHYHLKTRTKWKAGAVERVNRTIKTRLEKYFFKNKTKNWVDIIQHVVDNYNRTPHSTHKMAPLDVTAENRNEVYKRLYPDLTLRTVCKLKIGDKVRTIIEKKDWQKGYKQSWSDDIKIIAEIKQRAGICWYTLTDLEGKKIEGTWYYYQLNFVSRSLKNYARKSVQSKNK